MYEWVWSVGVNIISIQGYVILVLCYSDVVFIGAYQDL